LEYIGRGKKKMRSKRIKKKREKLKRIISNGMKTKKEHEIKQGEYESENEWIIFIMIKLNLPKHDFIP